MFECLARNYEVREIKMLKFDKGASVSSSEPDVDQPIKRPRLQSTLHEKPILSSRPVENVRGHTSYLTFATMLPKEDEEV